MRRCTAFLKVHFLKCLFLKVVFLQCSAGVFEHCSVMRREAPPGVGGQTALFLMFFRTSFFDGFLMDFGSIFHQFLSHFSSLFTPFVRDRFFMFFPSFIFQNFLFFCFPSLSVNPRRHAFYSMIHMVFVHAAFSENSFFEKRHFENYKVSYQFRYHFRLVFSSCSSHFLYFFGIDF